MHLLALVIAYARRSTAPVASWLAVGCCICIFQALFATAAMAGSTSVMLSNQIHVGDRFMSIRWLGALRLFSDRGSAPPVAGLSDLAWDQKTQVLYAVSDRGWLLHLELTIADEELRSAEVLAGYRLRGPDGAILTGRRADAEGLVLRHVEGNDRVSPELVVSFESEARIWRYSTNGIWMGEVSLPAEMTEKGYFASPNRGLEAIALHPRLGLVVAPESTPSGYRDGFVPLRDGADNEWLYPLAPFPESALTAMEFLADGSLVALERAFVSPLVPVIISVRQSCLPAPPDADLVVRDLAVFDAAEGWILDNFEGLTRLGKNRLLMISDDNARATQATFLVHFEVLFGVPDCYGYP